MSRVWSASTCASARESISSAESVTRTTSDAASERSRCTCLPMSVPESIPLASWRSTEARIPPGLPRRPFPRRTSRLRSRVSAGIENSQLRYSVAIASRLWASSRTSRPYAGRIVALPPVASARTSEWFAIMRSASAAFFRAR